MAQEKKSESAIRRAVSDYVEGFYEGDTVRLKASLSPALVKYGFWKNEKSSIFEGEGMSYRQAIDYAKKVFANKKFAKPDSPKEITILDIQEKIACAKLKAWWGVDYILLSKQDSKWVIDQVLWQGPLKTILN